jgi:hypothetical protein
MGRLGLREVPRAQPPVLLRKECAETLPALAPGIVREPERGQRSKGELDLPPHMNPLRILPRLFAGAVGQIGLCGLRTVLLTHPFYRPPIFGGII